MSKHERETYNVLPHFDVKWPLIGPEAVLLWPYYWEVGCLAHGQESGESLHGGFLPGLPGDSCSAFPGKVLVLLHSRTLPPTRGGSGDH